MILLVEIREEAIGSIKREKEEGTRESLMFILGSSWFIPFGPSSSPQL
jgi:hypothetical protein